MTRKLTQGTVFAAALVLAMFLSADAREAKAALPTLTITARRVRDDLRAAVKFTITIMAYQNNTARVSVRKLGFTPHDWDRNVKAFTRGIDSDTSGTPVTAGGMTRRRHICGCSFGHRSIPRPLTSAHLDSL